MIFGDLTPAEFVELQRADQVSAEDQKALDFARRIEFQPGGAIDQGWVDYYSQDFCHAFAIAAKEAHGGNRFVVVTDPYDLAHEAENPEDNLPAVVHVYAIIEHEGREWALDVFGMRPATSIQNEVVERYAAGIVACDEVSEIELKQFIRNPRSSSPTQSYRSLAELTDRIMSAAREHATEVLSALLPEAEATPNPR
jgi:hypothetical protein